MASEAARVRLRQRLEETLGVDEAAVLMDRPPGGWGDLVTNHTLERELGALRAELRVEMAELRAGLRGEMAELRADLRAEMRDQTRWLATLVIAGQGVLVAAVAAVGALLRFA